MRAFSHPAAVVRLATLLALPALTAEPELPRANLAAFARLNAISPVDGSRQANADCLAAQTNTVPLSLGPDTALLCEWDHPRPVRSVRLRFDPPPTNANPITVQWWRHIWPDNGSGGWMKLDDPFNGDWTIVRGALTRQGADAQLEFAPLDRNEAPGITREGPPERLTYKLRLLAPQPLRVRTVEVHSDAVLRRARLRFEWDVRTTTPGRWDPRFEARNGRLLAIQPQGTNAAVVEIEYADASDRLSPDRGYVLFRSGETRSFAVFVDDVLREGGLLVRDVGVFVSNADLNLTSRTWPGPSGEVWHEGTVAQQVASRPEQSFEQVSQAIPRKPAPYIFLGVPSLRQEVALLPQGQIQLRHDSLRSPGPDADARPWREASLVYDFAVGEHPSMGPRTEPSVTRSLEEGWLPVVRHTWTDAHIDVTETCLAAPLAEPLDRWASPVGTETVVLAARFELHNGSPQPRTASLWLELSRTDPLQLGLDHTLFLRHPSDRVSWSGVVPVRGRFDIHGRGELDLAVLEPGRPGSYHPARAESNGPREAIRYQIDLAPGESHTVDFFAPYVELLTPKEAIALQGLSFTNLHTTVTRFWRERVAQGMTYDVPDRFLNQFFKANLWHVLISTDLDPATGRHQHGAATHRYPNFLNETAMVARSLEMRGEHLEALRLLVPFLANQGVKGLPGNFKTREGVLYAAHPTEPDPYTGKGYNMHHGWGLWALAEHFFWTRNTNYLVQVLPQLALAADWITRERQATRWHNPDSSRRIEYGLAPAGDLEDVEEDLYFYATDAYFHLGMQTLVDALSVLHPPTALPGQPAAEKAGIPSDRWWQEIARLTARLEHETTEFRQDLRASLAESVASSPVVRLRDGTYVPYVPHRAYALTHLKEGWIREALYPALHLVNGKVYDAQHPFVDWMIQNLEDNLFLSPESGSGIPDPRRTFFNLGGFTLQPHLLDLSLVYLQRDQVPNFLRAFYNSAWASLHPDVLCFAEWVPRFGEGGGPLYKTPDECKFIQWMRQMLVLERDQILELGLGVPRAWMRQGQRIHIDRAATFFGSLTLEIVSHAATDTVTATASIAPTAKPARVLLRLRHPEGKPLRFAYVNERPAEILPERQMIVLPSEATHWQITASF